MKSWDIKLSDRCLKSTSSITNITYKLFACLHYKMWTMLRIRKDHFDALRFASLNFRLRVMQVVGSRAKQ